MAESLENIVQKEESAGEKKEKKKLDVAYWLSRAGGYLGSIAGTALTHKLTGSPYLAASVGNVAGDMIGEEVGWNPYWYSTHKERYKGLRGKVKYAKDWLGFTLRELPLNLAAYAIDIPLALGATYLTGNPVLGTAIGGAISELGYWLGFKKLTKSKIKRIAAEESYSSQNPAAHYGAVPQAT